MTDLPLPAYVPLPEPDGYFKNGSAAFWAEPNMHAYAAAKTAALQAECASHKRIADLCMDAARMSCAERDEARAECARLRASRDAYKHDAEALLKIVETLHQKEAK